MQKKIKEVMAAAFGVSVDSIPDNAQFNEFQPWDSLGHIAIMMGIEQEFGVTLTTESMQNALTIPAIEDYIKEALLSKAPVGRP